MNERLAQLYARAIWELVQNGSSAEKAVKSVHTLLATQGREQLISKVGVAFGRLAARLSTRDRVQLSVAREKDAKHAVKEAVEILKLKDGEMDVVVDETLIGGWRFESGDRLHDESYKHKLLTLYSRAAGAQN